MNIFQNELNPNEIQTTQNIGNGDFINYRIIYSYLIIFYHIQSDIGADTSNKRPNISQNGKVFMYHINFCKYG